MSSPRLYDPGKCPVCNRPFDCLRSFIKHLKRCEMGTDDANDIEKLKTLTSCKADLCEASTQQLNRLLSIPHGQGGESSVAGDATGCRSKPPNGVSRKGMSRSPDSSCHNSGESDS